MKNPLVFILGITVVVLASAALVAWHPTTNEIYDGGGCRPTNPQPCVEVTVHGDFVVLSGNPQEQVWVTLFYWEYELDPWTFQPTGHLTEKYVGRYFTVSSGGYEFRDVPFHLYKKDYPPNPQHYHAYYNGHVDMMTQFGNGSGYQHYTQWFGYSYEVTPFSNRGEEWTDNMESYDVFRIDWAFNGLTVGTIDNDDGNGGGGFVKLDPDLNNTSSTVKCDTDEVEYNGQCIPTNDETGTVVDWLILALILVLLICGIVAFAFAFFM